MPPAPTYTEEMSPPLLLFVAVEDWFFASHFLPLARAAAAAGFRVAVATRIRDHAAIIEATGARLIPLEGNRGSLNPTQLLGQVAALATILRQERPALLHLIGLRPILIGSLAARRTLSARHARLAHVTGMGLLGAGSGMSAQFGRVFLRHFLRPIANGSNVHFVFENHADPVTFGLDRANDDKVTIVGGAGVDPEAFVPLPLPPRPPLKLAMVSRMLWSKGVDIAVEAVTQARAKGIAVELDLYGDPDHANPRALPEATLRQWSTIPGITWHGRSTDVASIWASHHAALVPSRGGEGLPRTLLEAAACGRAILTTDVPGCSDFVRNGKEGFIVPPADADALAAAIAQVAEDPALAARFGAAARERLLSGFTEQAVVEAFMTLYRASLARRT